MMHVNTARRGTWLGLLNHFLVALITQLVFSWVLFGNDWYRGFTTLVQLESNWYAPVFYVLFFGGGWCMGYWLGRRLVNNSGAYVWAGISSGLLVALGMFIFWLVATIGPLDLLTTIYNMRELALLMVVVMPLTWLLVARLLRVKA